jgi:hypothetical protein
MSKYIFSVQRDGYRYEAVACLESWADNTIDNKRVELIMQEHEASHGVLTVINPFTRAAQFVKEFARCGVKR